MAFPLPITNGEPVIIDDIDSDLANYSWRRWPRGYIRCKSRRNGMRHKSLHRIIAKRKGLKIKGKQVDHKDHNRANNCRSNLRLATNSQNKANSEKYLNNTSGYKGVTHCNSKINPWQAQIQVSNKRIYLGVFTTPEKAHEAYIKSARKHFGEYAHG